MEIKISSWITVSQHTGDVCPVFRRLFAAEKAVAKAEMQITALGVYHAEINGRRVGDFVLAPGWTRTPRLSMCWLSTLGWQKTCKRPPTLWQTW